MTAPLLEDQRDLEPPPKPILQAGWFGNIPGGVLLAAVVLYVAGWSYLYGFYSAFGVSLDDLGFSLQEILVFANRVISWVGLLLLIAALLAVTMAVGLLVWLLRRFQEIILVRFSASSAPQKRDAFTYRHPIVAFCAGALMLYLGSWISIAHGQGDAAAAMKIGSSVLPMIQIDLKYELPEAMLNDSPKSSLVVGYRLLAHGQKGYFVFQPLQALPNTPGRSINVLFIPNEAVLSAQISTTLSKEAKK
jgi:hypothetical protein